MLQLRARRLALPRVPRRGLGRDPRRRHGRSRAVRLRRGLRPGGSTPATPGAWASSGSRGCATTSPTSGCCGRTTCGSWSSTDEGARLVAARVRATSTSRCAELAERMSMTGTKVEALHRRGVPSGLEFYRVGKVVTRERHPDADRLSLCTVDVGEGEPRQIVCGATNFAAGDTVAVALPGAVLPDGTRAAQGQAARAGLRRDDAVRARARALQRARRDHASARRPGRWAIRCSTIWPIADDVIEFEITSNRPDCQNVYGIAREVSAVLDTDLAPWPGIDPEPTGTGTVDGLRQRPRGRARPVPALGGAALHRRQGRPVAGVDEGRITAAGMRPISNVVDITNYVMLCVGEPTHAFDLDKRGRPRDHRAPGHRGRARDDARRPAIGRSTPTCW